MTTESSGENVCKLCGGSGTIVVDALDNTRECLCAYRKAIAARLGPELATAPFCDTSPLYVAGIEPGEAPTTDKTKNNLIIQGNWSDLLPHLKWAIGCKGLGFYHKIVTDEMLKTVYLGGRAAKVKREGQETFNSLGDLVSGEDYHLVIVRLGFLGYGNKAMPGILKESLLIRQAHMRPTWLIEEPNSPFVPGHYAYSEELYRYLVQNKYETISIAETAESKRSEPVGARRQADDTGHVSMGAEEPAQRRPVPRQERQAPRDQSNFDIAGLGIPGESKEDLWKKKNKQRRNGRGNGPL